MTETKNKPAATLRYGGIQAAIWKNPGKEDKSPRYTVNYTRSYTDQEGNWKDTTSFSELDNLKIGYLVPKVLEQITELKKQDQ